MIKKRIPGSFVSVDVTRRTRKSKFLQPIDTLIDWAVFEKELHKVCKRSMQDAAGRPAYNPLVLFKMMMLQTWYNLSDMGSKTWSMTPCLRTPFVAYGSRTLSLITAR